MSGAELPILLLLAYNGMFKAIGSSAGGVKAFLGVAVEGLIFMMVGNLDWARLLHMTQHRRIHMQPGR